ncbi:MAG: nuclear transport factor 2 family protein [Gemmatimonadetes bacterium]|nr:nuclear transport factor 2 family protein [Gemmatimonadota bacterium]
MKHALFLLLLIGSAACSTESARVRDARDAFYAAISDLDDAAVRGAVTADYIAVDGGRILTIDSLMTDLTMLQEESLSVRYAFADSAVQVDPPMAWVVYRSRRILQRSSSADTTFAVESAVFRREGGGWKLALLHRSPVSDGASFFETGTAVAEKTDADRGASTPAKGSPPRPPAEQSTPSP